MGPNRTARKIASRNEPNTWETAGMLDRRSPHALDMSDFVPAVLTNLAQRISASASAAYRPRFGVGITDWRIIALLAAEPWTAPVNICTATGLDKGAVSRSLRDLVESGLVEIRDDGANRRRLPFALTEKGLGIHDELVKMARAREADLLAGFSPEERVALLGFLERIQNRVDAAADGRPRDSSPKA